MRLKIQTGESILSLQSRFCAKRKTHQIFYFKLFRNGEQWHQKDLKGHWRRPRNILVRNSFHMLLLFFYAFPTYLKLWCPSSHCSLSHLCKREGPVCHEKIFASSVKSSSSGYVQREEHTKRVSLPCHDSLSSF